jgi:hypothetical protein
VGWEGSVAAAPMAVADVMQTVAAASVAAESAEEESALALDPELALERRGAAARS